MQWEIFEIALPLMGIEFNALLLVGIGLGVGVLAAFFGIGGGWIVTPTLNILGFPMPFAIGTALANITAQNGVALAKHRRMGTVEPFLGVAIGVTMALGMEAGAQVVMYLTSLGLAGAAIRWAYVFFLGGLGVWMQYDYWKNRHSPGQPSGDTALEADACQREKPVRGRGLLALKTCQMRVSLWKVAALGLGVGCVAGLLGCGGGFILVPALIYVIGVPTMVAVGTSLVCTLVAGAYGTFTYALKGRVELIAALWIVAGAVVGVQFGASAVR